MNMLPTAMGAIAGFALGAMIANSAYLSLIHRRLTQIRDELRQMNSSHRVTVLKMTPISEEEQEV